MKKEKKNKPALFIESHAGKSIGNALAPSQSRDRIAFAKYLRGNYIRLGNSISVFSDNFYFILGQIIKYSWMVFE